MTRFQAALGALLLAGGALAGCRRDAIELTADGGGDGSTPDGTAADAATPEDGSAPDADLPAEGPADLRPSDGPEPADLRPAEAACNVPCLAALPVRCPALLPCLSATTPRGFTRCFANGVKVRYGGVMMAPHGVFYGASVRAADGSLCYYIQEGATPDAPFVYRDATGSVLGRGMTGANGRLTVSCTADGQTYEANSDCPGRFGPQATCSDTAAGCS